MKFAKNKQNFSADFKIGERNSDDAKLFLIRVLLILLSFICMSYTILNLFFCRLFYISLVNAFSVLFSLIALLYFEKTKKYKPTAFFVVAIVFITLIAYLNMMKNQYYALYWIVIFPPIVYFLLEKKQAIVISILYSLYMMIFMLRNMGSWEPAAFGIESVINIAGATFGLIMLIGIFEKSRKDAWASLKHSHTIMEDNKNRLQLILDSTAEAICGVDLEGRCTFCNSSCVNILGFQSQEELLGRDMHASIKPCLIDGAPSLGMDHIFSNTFKQGNDSVSTELIFRKADGSSFYAECRSYPQISNGNFVGMVVTFLDISERKKREDEIKYLSSYDFLTGLQNRRCFEERLKDIDAPENFPLSIIFADINGLKLTNDVFGHKAGDALIKKSSEILIQSCRPGDIITRFGGDEFIILLPRTDSAQAQIVIDKIREGFSQAKVAAIKCSISMGLNTKHNTAQSIDVVMTDAENTMYKDKTNNRVSNDEVILDNIVDTLHTKSPRERQHALIVSKLCVEMGRLLNLPAVEINKLRRAGYLHDIGKIVIDDGLLLKELLTHEEREEMQQHAVCGYRILNLFDETVDLAELVYNHHERWDGKGYPRGLKGDEIPLIARIISIVETYERVIYREIPSGSGGRERALQIIREGAGEQFDPGLAVLFADMIESKNSQCSQKKQVLTNK